MEIYLLKSGLCLAILFGFYKLFLENESMHVFKRFYLLGVLVISFLTPLITFKTYVEIPATTSPVIMETSTVFFTEIESKINYWPFILWSFYAMGVLYFSIKFGKNLNRLLSRIKNNPKLKQDAITHVLLKSRVIPHTFFNYVFLEKQKYEAREIPDEVIQHEHIHARQKHSIDILLVELLQILFWFNPCLYFIKRSIKLNHEFLADRAVLKQGVETTAYQKILLAFSSTATTPALANSINYSFIKKRFTVMKKQTSTKTIWLRTLLIVPLLAILLYGFSAKEIIQKEILQVENVTGSLQEKASPEMVKEYNVIAKKWNDPNATNFKYVEGEKERALYIYSRMSESQKKESEPFPVRITQLLENIPASPTPPSPPFPENLTALIEDIRNKNGVFFYGNEKISYKQALKIAKSKEYKGGIRTNYEKKPPELYLLKNGDTQAPPAPPAPNTPEVGKVPPVPPIPPVPPMPSVPDPMELIEKVEKNGGEFYLDDEKVTVSEFKDKFEQIRTTQESFCINYEKGDNGKDRLRITIQE